MSTPTALYRKLAELPIYTAAAFLKSTNSLRVTTSVRDHVNNKKRALVKHIAILGNGHTAIPIGVPQEQHESIVAVIVSPSGNKLAYLKQVENTGKPPSRFVEIWTGSKAELILEVTKEHGDFYGDDTFSSLTFGPSETSLLYTAEANAPETTGDSSKNPDIFKKFRFDPAYGERFPGRKRPRIFKLSWKGDGDNLSKEDVTTRDLKPAPLKVENYEEGSAIAHATFVDGDENQILAMRYEPSSDGRKLGIVYCTNRAASIIQLISNESISSLEPKKEGETTELRFDASVVYSDRPARSPRVWSSNDGKTKTAIWLTFAPEPHGSCAALHVWDFKSSPKTIVDSVWEPSEKDGFPGLTMIGLPTKPFVTLDGRPWLAISSSWRSRNTILLIDLESGEIKNLTPVEKYDGEEELWSWNVLACEGDQVVAYRSSPRIPQQLVLGRISTNKTAEWEVIDRPELDSDLESKLKGMKAQIIQIPDRHPVETIVVTNPEDSSKDGEVAPCITFPHGGPHAVTTTDFSPGQAAVILSGYTLSYPNYRGSTGFGQKYVEALLGNCGSVDIEDTLACTKHLIKLGFSKEGKGYQFVSGGSHGGFITSHLVGQYPDVYTAAVMRNPVTDIPKMFATTDIPDWCTVECGHPYSRSETLPPSLYKSMHEASPIAHIDKVKTPVLLLMGDIDLRVPPSQGMNYYHGLKERGKEVEMLWFPGNNHALDKVEAEIVGWEASWIWMEKFRKKAKEEA